MEDIIIFIVLGSIGITLIFVGVYVRLLANEFKKNGISLKFKAINCEKQGQHNQDGKKIGEFYITTFEFTHKDVLLKESIKTKKEFEIGKLYDGIFLPGVNYSKISIQDEGDSITNGKEWLFIIAGILILVLIITTIIL